MVGVFGNYSGSCVSCMRGTDTALAFQGEIEWIAAALIHLGVPKIEAIATVRDPATPLEIVDGGTRYRTIVRVCEACAAVSTIPFKPTVIMDGADIPILGQRL